ncbi:MAG: 4-hydroxy-3-methylbut-2-enyl diphosphate reductase [Thermodesulfobacteriota bacterium]
MTEKKTDIIVAETAGFCMGVSLALHKLDEALIENKQKRICTLGPIIHNPQVLNKYRQKGVIVLADVNEAQPDDRVVIRAHGIPLNREKELQNIGSQIVDATCPKVKKAQRAIHELSRDNHLLLFGEPEHPEVKGLLSYARNDWTIIENEKQLNIRQINTDRHYLLTAQTTQDRNQFRSVRDKLQKKLGSKLRIADTICEATRNRQQEAILIAKQVDCMLVIGGRISGNTRRLVQVISDQSLPCLHIETAGELDINNLKKYDRIGITAGASTPGDIIQEVIKALDPQGVQYGTDRYPS